MKLSDLCRWYNQRALRERVLLLICALVVVIFSALSFFVQPGLQRAKAAQRELTDLHRQIKVLKADQEVMTAQARMDPDQDSRRRLAALKEEAALLQQTLEKNVVGLVAPRDMPQLLKQLLTRQKNLRLLRLENLPPQAISFSSGTDGTQEQAEEARAMLYRHGLRLEFSGDYLSLLAYLRQLQELPRALVWEEILIETLEYPQAKVSLQLHTLSLTEDWIGG